MRYRLSINRPYKCFTFLIIAAVLIITTGCYKIYDDRKENAGNLVIRYYTIDSATILDALDRGDTDVFTFQETTPEATGSPLVGSVSWSQADYFRIAQTLHQKIWSVPLGAQTLYNGHFQMNCTGVQQVAYNGAIFNSFQMVRSGEEEIRIEYAISIFPSHNEVRTTKLEFKPSTGTYKPIDLAQYRITAEAALQIAEKNGGMEKRLGVQNTCQIDLFAPGPDGKGWDVSYRDKQDNYERYFEIAIDPQTGEFKVLYPKS